MAASYYSCTITHNGWLEKNKMYNNQTFYVELADQPQTSARAVYFDTYGNRRSSQLGTPVQYEGC